MASYFILGKGEIVLGETFQENSTEIKFNEVFLQEC